MESALRFSLIAAVVHRLRENTAAFVVGRLSEAATAVFRDAFVRVFRLRNLLVEVFLDFGRLANFAGNHVRMGVIDNGLKVLLCLGIRDGRGVIAEEGNAGESADFGIFGSHRFGGDGTADVGYAGGNDLT